LDIVERAQREERELQEKDYLRKMNAVSDTTIQAKLLEEQRVKKDLDARIQRMKERDEARKEPEGLMKVGKSSGVQPMIEARRKSIDLG